MDLHYASRTLLKSSLLCASLFLASSSLVMAQGRPQPKEGATPPSELYHVSYAQPAGGGRGCGFDQHLQAHEGADPHARAQREAFDQRIRAWLAANPQARTTNTTYVIPTVVHCVQASATNTVSDACVLSQIEVLNEDFQALNADTSLVPAEFAAIIGNVSIEFCLATKDPQGNPTNGIVRIIDANNASHSMGNAAQLKALSQWDPNKYFNIWVPEIITGGVLGYATFPSSLTSNPSQDGIVVAGNYWGRGGCGQTPYHLGRTATHEAGHWLGLYHTFEGGCAGNDASTCATAGDQICDTPPTASSNFGCPGVQNTCTETPVDHNDQTHNYMDYGDDNCIVMFSDGQVDRVHAVLNTTRAQLVSQANHTATGCGCSDLTPCTPVANFTADNIVICPGQTVNFSDLSTGPASSWTWSFTGGTPFAATSQNPSVTYSSPGVYDVSLQVTNSQGTATYTATGYITVTNAATPPVSEGFETTLPSDWQVYNEDNQVTWAITNTAASLGVQSMWIDHWTYEALGSSDAILTRTIDLTNYGSGELTFDHAYKMAAFINDTLNVYFSIDCGESWTQVWSKGGQALASVSGVGISQGYVPAGPTDFKHDTISITPYVGTDGFKVKFESIGRGGQNMYLDNINLSALVGAEGPSQPRWAMTTAPNPFSDQLSLSYHMPKAASLRLSLFDLNGREVLSTPSMSLPAGRGQYAFSAEALQGLAPGVYVLRGESNLGNMTRKVVKVD